MKRNGLLFALCLGFAAFFAAVPASAAAGLKIGIIDTQKILRDSEAAKRARAVLAKEVSSKRGVLKAKDDEVRALQEELKKEGKSLSETARRDKFERFEKEVKELRRLKSDLEEELKKRDRELTRKVLLEIVEVVREYSRKQKFTLILEKRTVVASDDALDITDKIIRLYDAVK